MTKDMARKASELHEKILLLEENIEDNSNTLKGIATKDIDCKLVMTIISYEQEYMNTADSQLIQAALVGIIEELKTELMTLEQHLEEL